MFVFSLVMTAVLIAVDQIIKLVVDKNIDMFENIEVIKLGSVKVFSLTHIRNAGAAWSIMEGKTWFLVLLPIVVCSVGFYYMYKIKDKAKLEMFSVALVIAGGLGNLIDRIRLKEVIDYIKFEPINFPIFNFADICIVVGAILFTVSVVISDVAKRKEKKGAEG